MTPEQINNIEKSAKAIIANEKKAKHQMRDEDVAAEALCKTLKP